MDSLSRDETSSYLRRKGQALAAQAEAHRPHRRKESNFRYKWMHSNACYTTERRCTDGCARRRSRSCGNRIVRRRLLLLPPHMSPRWCRDESDVLPVRNEGLWYYYAADTCSPGRGRRAIKTNEKKYGTAAPSVCTNIERDGDHCGHLQSQTTMVQVR